MQGWPGGPPSLARLNPIYSEAEESGAGRSKASSSGYGSQRGSGGGSVSDRPPPPLPRRGTEKDLQLPIWHHDSSEDPYTIYSTCSVRDEIGQDDHYIPRKHSYSTIGTKEDYLRKNKFNNSDDGFLTKQSRYLPKVGRGYSSQPKIEDDFFSRHNKTFVSGDVSKADLVYDSDGYLSKNRVVNETHPKDAREETAEVLNECEIDEKKNQFDKLEVVNERHKEKPKNDYDSLQADPFLLYSQFIRQEEAKAKERSQLDNSIKVNSGKSDTKSIKSIKSNNESREQIDCDKKVEDAYTVVGQNSVSLSVAREDYLRALLQDIAVALEEALASRRLESQGGLIQEAQENVALGLVTLRRAGPDELRQLSCALSRGPPRPLPRPTTPPAPSPHAHKPSLWFQYYMRSHSLHSTDSINTCFIGDLRPEAQFTLGVAGERRLAGRLAAARRARCICRLLSASLALFFFLLALVLCSLLLSGGRAMFGSMM